MEQRNVQFRRMDANGVMHDLREGTWGDQVVRGVGISETMVKVWEDDLGTKWKCPTDSFRSFKKPRIEPLKVWASIRWSNPPEYLQPHPTEWKIYKNYHFDQWWGHPSTAQPFFLVAPLSRDKPEAPRPTALSWTQHPCAELGPFAAESRKKQRAKNSAIFKALCYFGPGSLPSSMSKKR